MKPRTVLTVFLALLLVAPALVTPVPLAKTQQEPSIYRGDCYIDTDLGDGLHSWESAPQWVFNGDEYVPYIFEDHYASDGYYQVQSGLIGVQIYDYYAKFYSPDMAEVRLYDERWEVERWTGKKWSDIGAQSGTPTITVSQWDTGVNITKVFNSWAGELTIIYIFREGRALKHTVYFDSNLEDGTVFNVYQKFAGLVADKVNGHTINSATIIEGSQFTFTKEDGSLSVYENQWKMYYGFNETTGEYYVLENKNLKLVTIDVHTQGLKVDFKFGNFTLAQGERLEIDPDTATLNNPTVDGYSHDGASWHDDHEEAMIAEDHSGNVYRSAFEWDVSGIPNDVTITNTVFKYHGSYNFALDAHIHEMLGYQPSLGNAASIHTEAGEGTVYADPAGFPVEGTNQQVDLGSTADADLQAQLASNDWFAIGVQADFDPSGLQFSKIFCEERGGVTPPPTLYVTFSLPNNAPTITSASISDMDTDDNVYAMKQYYSFVAVVNDADGATDISDVYLQGKNGAGVLWEVRATSLDGVPSWDIESGSDIIDLDTGSCTWGEAGDVGTATFFIRTEGDHGNLADLEIAVYVEDSATDSAGFTDMQTDYWDAINRMVTTGLASSESHIDVSFGTTISGTVYYADGVASDTASAFIPANALFTAIHAQSAAHDSLGNDASIVNGAFSFTATSASTSLNDAVHIYLDLAPDFSDVDAPDGDTVSCIWDQIEIVSVAFPDNRVNIGAASEVRYVLRWDYDDVAFEAGNSIVGFTWDGVNSWWDKAVTAPATPVAELYDENDLGAITDVTHGITVIEDDAGTNLIGDRVNFKTATFETTDAHINSDATGEWYAELLYEYDSAEVTDGSVALNVGAMGWDGGGDHRWEYTNAPAAVTDVARNIVSIAGNTHGITTLNAAIVPDSETIEFDEVVAFDYDQRTKLTINSTDIDEVLTNFPVLIFLSNSSSGENDEDLSFIFDEVGANSKKIAVTTADGITQCYVEIEHWNATTEQAWLWVKVPSISNTTDTVLYLYFDNDHADNNDYVGVTNSVVAENVWDADFLMVQHQADAVGPIRDSTSNDIDMTEKSDPIYQQAGQIDGAIDYDENDNHFSAVDVFDAIVGTGKGTIGFWIKTTTETASLSHYVFSIEGGYVLYFSTIDNDGKLRMFWSGSGADFVKTNTVINDGNWHYVVTTYDGANQLAYVAGNFENTDVCNLVDITGFSRVSRITTQWDWSAGVAAVIDDVRVSKIDRSSSWIKATYESGRDHLIDFGGEDSQGSGLAVTDGRIDFNVNGEWYIQLMLDNNNVAITAGTITLNTGTMSYDGGDSRWEYTNAPGSVGLVSRNIASVSGITGGITKVNAAVTGDSEDIIFDNIELVSVAFPDSRVNIGTVTEVRYVLRYNHDNVAFEGADGSIIGYLWDGGNGWWDKAITAPAVAGADLYDENDLGALTDGNYDLTTYEDDAGSSLIGDRLEILSVAFSDSRVDVGAFSEVRYTIQWDYDNVEFGAGQAIAGFAWDAGNSWWDKTVTAPVTPILETYDENDLGAITDNTYGITAIEDDAGAGLIGDRIRMLTLEVNTTNPFIGADVLINGTWELEYDGHPITNGDTIDLTDGLTGTTMAWSGAIFELTDTSPATILVTYDEFTGTEVTFGITAVNPDGVQIIIQWGVYPINELAEAAAVAFRHNATWVNITISDASGVADLYYVEIYINTTDNTNHFTLRWWQANNTFVERSDPDNICTLNATASTRVNIDGTHDRIEFVFTLTGGEDGLWDTRVNTTDDGGLYDLDYYPALFEYVTYGWGPIGWLINSAFAYWGVIDFMTGMVTYITGIVGYFGTSLTWMRLAIVQQFSVIINIFPWFIRWFTRVVSMITGMMGIIVSIFNGTHTIMSGIQGLWDTINLASWVDLITMMGIFMWLDSLGKREKTRGLIPAVIDDLQTMMNILGYFTSMFAMVFNTVIDIAFRLFEAITI